MGVIKQPDHQHQHQDQSQHQHQHQYQNQHLLQKLSLSISQTSVDVPLQRIRRKGYFSPIRGVQVLLCSTEPQEM